MGRGAEWTFFLTRWAGGQWAHDKMLNITDYWCRSVAQSRPALCDPVDCSTPGSSVLHHFPELAQLISIESVMVSNHLILCCLLLLPSIFPSIRVFSNETTLHIRWPKYWRTEVEAHKSSFRLKQTDPSRERSPLGL